MNGYLIWGNGRPNAGVWTLGTRDPRALAPEARNGQPRNATCSYTDTAVGCRNTMTFTINTTDPREYQLALYFVDWDNRERCLAVELHDAHTLDLIAPVKVVNDFVRGKYLVYACRQSVKVRVDHVWGDNAVLSGIFFDPAPARTAAGLRLSGD